MFFGYYLSGCLVIVIATLLGAGSGYLTFLLSHRRTQVAIAVGTVTTLLVLLGICGYYVIYTPNDYYNYAGDFDFYRMPLDYPYELSMIDMIDCAGISRWKEDKLLVAGISHYYKRDNLIVGKISAECFAVDTSAWFSFDTKTGRVEEYKTEEEFRRALKELGFDQEPELRTIQENWDLFWRGS